MRTCMVHSFKNISRESIGYSTKSALTGLNIIYHVAGK